MDENKPIWDNILVVLPAFNEAKVIVKVISDIKSEGFLNILLVDDCSKDDTYMLAKENNVNVLRHVINRGAGAATSTGLIYAKNKSYDYVVFMDSDGQHLASDIKRLLKYSKKYDVVIGSRMIAELKNMPFFRRLANFIGSFLTWFFFGLFVRDSQSGFKVFNKKAISNINLLFDRYEFCSEIIGEIKKSNLSYFEVPIRVRYSDHSLNKEHGQSIFNGFRMVLRFIFRN